MQTAMSTKRNYVSGRHKAMSYKGYTAFAILGGLFLMVIGVKTDLTFLAVSGFVPFTTALLYINAKFWADMYDSKSLPNLLVHKKIPPIE